MKNFLRILINALIGGVVFLFVIFLLGFDFFSRLNDDMAKVSTYVVNLIIFAYLKFSKEKMWMKFFSILLSFVIGVLLMIIFVP